MPTQGHNKRKTASSNNEEKTAKRSRVSRACDQCRTAREKCDGGQPICFTCTASKRDCTYTANPKKRGIQPGYIRSLELALTWLFQNTDSEVILNKKLAQEGTASVLLGRDTKESNKLHKSWRKSRFCKDIDKLLSGEEIPNHKFEGSRTPESDDEDTEDESTAPNFQPQLAEEGSLTVRQNYPGNISPNTTRIINPREPGEAPLFFRPISNTPLRAQVSAGVYPTVLPPNRWRLFDLYFAYTHCWFPISEKHDVLKLTYSYPEHGLSLSSARLPNSGDHAELWSILALASLQESHVNAADPRPDMNLDANVAHYTPVQLYDIARTLIPLELEAFELGHVKALLILALFNISQSNPEAAWMVVGHSSRIIMRLESTESSRNLRFRHVFAGCFLLDTLVSIQLQRRPYLQRLDLDHVGRVNQDGLEEWQPWAGCLGLDARIDSRTPVLSLSTFNNFVEIASIMGLADSHDNSASSVQETIRQTELWKASLPPTFEYLRTEHVATPSTPPALLLQLIYHCSSLVIFPTQPWIHRTLELLEHFRNALGLAALPPILHCLFEHVYRSKAFAMSDQGLQNRFQKLRSDFTQAWTYTFQSGGIQGSVSSHSKRRFGSAYTQLPETPDSIQMTPYNTSFIPINNAAPALNPPRTSSTLLDDLLPDMNTANSTHARAHAMDFQNALAMQNFDTPQFESAFNPALLHHRNSSASRDIEHFFDDLASLDGAERVENQPQFMKNLGFAPDANMADLLSAEFGQFGSLNQVYMAQSGNDGNHLDPNAFYDAS